MIHFIKTASRHRHYVNFGNLSADQIGGLLKVLNASTRAMMPSVEFPEGSPHKVVEWSSLTSPRDFMSSDGTMARVDAMKAAGSEILDAIENNAKVRIAEMQAEADEIEDEAPEDSDEDEDEDEDGEGYNPNAYKAQRLADRIARHQKRLEKFQGFRDALDV